MIKKLIVLVAAMAGAGSWAQWVPDGSIRLAAEVWLSSDRVAQLTMKGLSFGEIEHRGSLRVVRLSPAGYIVDYAKCQSAANNGRREAAPA